MSTESTPAPPNPARHEAVEPVTLTPDEARRGKYVSKERFDEVLADLKTTMTELTATTTKLTAAEQARQAAESSIASTRAELESQLEEARGAASWADAAIALARDGYTNERATRYIRQDFEGRDAAEDGTRADWATWWGEHAADYEQVFGGLKAPPASAAPPAPSKPPVNPKKGAPPPKTREDNNAKPINNDRFSEDAILNMSNEDFKANKDSLIKGVFAKQATG